MIRIAFQRMLGFSLVGFLTCLLTTISLAQRPPELAPLPIADSLAAKSFVYLPMSLCPTDPEWIVYQLSDRRRLDKMEGDLTPSGAPRLARGGEIWITNGRTGQTTSVSGNTGLNWAPKWSPDGKFIAFFSDRSGKAGVWLWQRSSGRLQHLSQISPRFYSGRDTVTWSSDSKRLFIKVVPDHVQGAEKAPGNPAGTVDAKKVSLSIYESVADPKRTDSKEAWATGSVTPENFHRFTADLVAIDIADGKVQRLAHNQVVAGYWLSLDGSTLAFLAQKGVKHNGKYLTPVFDLTVVSIREGRPVVLAGDVVQGVGDMVSWSPDGKWLAYVSVLESKANLFVVPASGGVARKIPDDPKAGPFSAWPQLPIWAKDNRTLYGYTSNAIWQINLNGSVREVAKLTGKRVRQIIAAPADRFWSPDSRSIFVIAADLESKRTDFFKVELASGKVSTPFTESNVSTAPLINAVIEGDSNIYYVSENSSHSPELWALDANSTAKPRRITHVNPVFDRYVMGESRIIEWRGADGQKLRGAVLLPSGYSEGQRYPLIVHIYGGAMLSENANMFGFNSSLNKPVNMQFWATRGYAVLMPDSPLKEGTPMLDLAKTILPGIDRIVELGIADPERMALWGGSYGGYSTMALLTQTPRFKVAVCDAGFVSMTALYGFMSEQYAAMWQGWAEVGQGNMGGTPWQYRERYLENSPLFYLDRVQTPVLIIQGTEDPGAKDFLSNEIFVNLKRLGKEATYLKYHGASHTITSFSYDEQVDVLNRLVGWFDKHLKVSNETVSSKP